MKRIALIGAGRLATQLARALRGLANPDLLQIYNRTPLKAKELANDVSGEFVSKIEELEPDLDLYILAVSDRAIGEVAEQLASEIAPSALVVHTSGATPSTVLADSFSRFGVFYPLQTFSPDYEPDFRKIPLLVYADDPADQEQLLRWGQHLSEKCQVIDDAQRATLHVAAVFACNFVNHQYHIAREILAERGLSFDLLRPLIAETARLVEKGDPAENQTGPAIRGDQPTIDRHVNYLREHPHWQEIYDLLTQSIQRENEEK